MERFDADQQIATEIDYLLQRIKYQVSQQGDGISAYFPISRFENNIFDYEEPVETQILFEKLKEMGVIEIDRNTTDENNKILKDAKEEKNKGPIIVGWLIKPIEPKFSELCKTYGKQGDKNASSSFLNTNKTLANLADNSTSEISYDHKTGIGKINGRTFLISPDDKIYEVFGSLFGMMNMPLSRYDVLVTSEFYKEGATIDPARRTSETNHINEIAKTIRRTLKINPKILVNNDGNLTLIGKKVKIHKIT